MVCRAWHVDLEVRAPWDLDGRITSEVMRTLQAGLIVDRASFQSVALAGDGDQFRVVEEPVEDGCRGGYVADELAPVFQRPVRRNDQRRERSSPVAGTCARPKGPQISLQC